MDQRRRRSLHGFEEADIFRQINFWDLAAEFAKEERRLTMLRFLVSCRGMYIVSYGQRTKANQLACAGRCARDCS